MTNLSKFFHPNLHILVIDDKIGNSFSKYSKHFSYKIKTFLKIKSNKTIKQIYIHYCENPKNLKKILSRNSKMPIDIILIDIDFERIEGSEFAVAFKYNGLKNAGFNIYKYLDKYIQRGIDTIPKIIISGEKYIEDRLKKNMVNYDYSKIEVIKKIDEDWIRKTADKVWGKYDAYYNKEWLSAAKTSHLLDRLQKQIRYTNILNDRGNEDRLNLQIPHINYTIELKKLNSSKILGIYITNSEGNHEGERLYCKFEHDDNWTTKTISEFDGLDAFLIKIPEETENYLRDQIYMLFKNINFKNVSEYFNNLSSSKKSPPFDEFGEFNTKEKITVENKTNCTGCGRCLEGCPNKAIELTKNYNDIYPKIDYYKCINCGKCLSVCKHNVFEKYNIKKEELNGQKEKWIEFGGKKFKNRIFLAATPVTAINISESSEKKIKYYKNKIINLYKQSKAGGIILKTVYLENEINKKTTNDSKTKNFNNIRQYGVTRALTTEKGEEISSIYNTGKTAKENLNILELKEFLFKFKDESSNIVDSLIISLGSHSISRKIWEDMFKELFKGEKNSFINKEYDFIEVNARHAMRKISRMCSKKENNKKLDPYIFGVDEYFISPDISNYTGFWNIFREWVEIIQRLGKNYNKKIMIKLPYRSDLNMLVFIINDVIEKCKDLNKVNEDNKTKENKKKSGIVALSAINTIKSPYMSKNLDGSEFFKIPQVSGKGLTKLRNITLYVLNNINKKLDISASGGITDEEDVKQSYALGAKTIQLSTWYLKNGDVGIRNLLNINYNNIYNSEKSEFIKNINKLGEESLLYFNTMQMKKIPRRKIKFKPERCLSCGNCTNTFYCDAIMNKFNKGEVLDGYLIPRSPIINVNYCTGCGLCTAVCEENALEVIYENALDKKTPDSIDKCPFCENKKKKIYLYPKEYDGDIEKQYYLCSNCRTIYFNKNGNSNFKIYSLIDKTIDISNNFNKISLSLSGENKINIDEKYYNINTPDVKNSYKYHIKLEIFIPHLLDIQFKFNGKILKLKENNFKNLKALPITKKNYRYDLHAENQSIVIDKKTEKEKSILLASESERRINFFKKKNFIFKSISSNIDEDKLINKIQNKLENASKNKEQIIIEGIKWIALEKAKSILEKDKYVIAMDTIFIFNNQVIGKPENYDTVKRNLLNFSGKKVFIYTGIAILYGEIEKLGFEKTILEFKEISNEDIDRYLKYNKCLDKAGGFSIQDGGIKLVRNIEGDYNNIVGIPEKKFTEMFNEIINK